MKLILLLLLLNCGKVNPKFKIGQEVIFDMPDVYFGECYNVGTIDAITYTIMGNVAYSIKTLRDYKYMDCPYNLVLFEKNVRDYSPTLRRDIKLE